MSNKRTIFSLIFVAVLMFVALGWSCNENSNKVHREAIQKYLNSYQQTTTTPSGVTVRFKENQPTQEQLAAIDKGFDWLDQKVVKYGYGETSERTTAVIILAKSDRDFDSEGNFVPIINVPINCKAEVQDYFCGTIYDKGLYKIDGKTVHKWIHYIWAAELTLDEWIDPAGNKGVVAYSPNRHDELTMARATNYFGEHWILRRKDRVKFDLTRSHQLGGHPLLPLDNGELVASGADEPPKYQCAHDPRHRPMCVVK
jgi:hypothetical protein